MPPPRKASRVAPTGLPRPESRAHRRAPRLSGPRTNLSPPSASRHRDAAVWRPAPAVEARVRRRLVPAPTNPADQAGWASILAFSVSANPPGALPINRALVTTTLLTGDESRQPRRLSLSQRQ